MSTISPSTNVSIAIAGSPAALTLTQSRGLGTSSAITTNARFLGARYNLLSGNERTGTDCRMCQLAAIGNQQRQISKVLQEFNLNVISSFGTNGGLAW